ncbi:MAG: hydantoinase B/oxoprolinase family protein, partial [Deltaproteobacteria bacterium]
PGRRRGGCGKRVVFRVPDDDTAPQGEVSLGVQTGRLRHPPEGLFGGRPGRAARFEVDGKPADPYALTRLRPGQRVLMEAAGGGGFGNPLEREPELVAKDVREGYVSEEAARREYGVELTAGGEADLKATAELRKRLAAGESEG